MPSVHEGQNMSDSRLAVLPFTEDHHGHAPHSEGKDHSYQHVVNAALPVCSIMCCCTVHLGAVLDRVEHWAGTARTGRNGWAPSRATHPHT